MDAFDIDFGPHGVYHSPLGCSHLASTDEMFIAIVGTPSAGKKTVLEYLVTKYGFQELGLESPKELMDAAKVVRLVLGQCRYRAHACGSLQSSWK